MSNISKQLILKYLLQYLKNKSISYKKCGKIAMVKCPFCNREPFSATILPNTNIIKCLPCEKTYNLLDIVKELEFKETEKTEDELVQFVKELLKLDIVTKQDEKNIDEHLDFYVKNGFDLVPIVKGKKIPCEKDWTNKSHKDKTEWVRWINDGLNLGIKTGRKSNILILDIDQKPVPEELKKLLGDTLVQESTKGFHYFYKYDEKIPKTRIDEVKMDVESEGGQVVIFPSSIKGIQRKILELKKPIDLPPDLKKFILKKVTVPVKTNSEKIREDIETESFTLGVEAEGKRNSSLIKLGGIIRKFLNITQTENILNVINNHVFKNPLPPREVSAMSRELDKYITIDNQELIHDILKYLREVEESSKNDIELTILGKFTSGEQKKILNKSLLYLEKEHKVLKKGKYYHLIKEMDWKESLIDIGIPIDFKMPYFHNYANFNWGDMILIASRTKFGKTHLAVNIIERIAKQNKIPYYLCSEGGGRFAKIALKLGLKEGQFKWDWVTDPMKIKIPKKELGKHPVVIYDWLLPNSYAETDKIFKNLQDKINERQGILIIFMQLKEDTKYFAENLVRQFPSFACKYLYVNEEDGTYTEFKVTDVRDSKINKKFFSIPCKYDWDTKEVKTIEEIKGEKPLE